MFKSRDPIHKHYIFSVSKKNDMFQKKCQDENCLCHLDYHAVNSAPLHLLIVPLQHTIKSTMEIQKKI